MSRVGKKKNIKQMKLRTNICRMCQGQMLLNYSISGCMIHVMNKERQIMNMRVNAWKFTAFANGTIILSPLNAVFDANWVSPI